MNRQALVVCFLVALTKTVAQVPTMDGRLDPGIYGPALSLQNTETQFGDAIQGDQVDGAGSELDGIYATVANNRLYVMMTGNLEPNFNKLEVFFDTRPGGFHQLDGTTLPTGVDAFCCGGFGTKSGALQKMDGLTFDAGFAADYYLTFNHGFETGLDDPNAPGNPITFWALSAHYADMTGTAPADRQNVAAGMQLAPQGLPNVLRFNGSQNFDEPPYLPSVSNGSTIPNHLGPALPNLSQGELIDRDYALDPAGGQCPDDSGFGCLATELGLALDQAAFDPVNFLSHRNFNNLIDLQLGFDNSNTSGVTGAQAPPWLTSGDPAAVTTGLEFSIPLAEIGNPTGDVALTMFINGVLHDFASNQFSGEGILQGNLGGDGINLANVDLSAIAGDQFVTITVPEPSGWLFAAVAFVVLRRSGCTR